MYNLFPRQNVTFRKRRNHLQIDLRFCLALAKTLRVTPVETYLKHLSDIRSSGDATDETSYYTALNNLLDEVGKDLTPRVRSIFQLKNRGAGHPDGGLYTSDQFQKGEDEPIAGQKPARGAIEVKSTGEDAFATAEGHQVTKYWGAYGQVLVTNYRDFVLVERSRDGSPISTESFKFSETEREFWLAAAHPKKVAKEKGEQFVEFLKRVMLSSAPLSDPYDVAWFLASYARDARARIEAKKKLTAMASIRSALEVALGLDFRGDKGEHFFRSSLIQTIFYGIFSAWVLWSRELDHNSAKKFEWRMTAWKLRVKMIKALFEQIASATQLEALGFMEVLDWTETRLNSVLREEFFRKFEQEDAVQYFYEPFLEAFDPELRKQLGVWYTPVEVVRYMVARTDTVLREELGIEDGFADPRVYVLDPACGTGAFLLEVLNCIKATLEDKGDDALLATEIKAAAVERIFGFEILPAPFVISHLQIGMFLEKLGAEWDAGRNERARVYLTNALTGWLPPKEPKDQIVFPAMQEERDAADGVKQKSPILVIIGNPPYDGFAEVGMEEEQKLIAPYRKTMRGPKPQGQGLNNLFVRFFRVAERKIVEGTGSLPGTGVVCLITNYRWLDGLSHPGMRERFLESFDRIWIDNLNGDAYRTGKVTPAGDPDPSVFSTQYNREGIQNGTDIALLLRKPRHLPTHAIEYREFWGARKRQEILEALREPGRFPYETYKPRANDGFVFMPTTVSAGYLAWPRLTDIFATAIPGVKTSRDSFLVDIDKSTLEGRIKNYFDPDVTHDEIRQRYPSIMQASGTYVPETARDYLRHRSKQQGKILRYCYRAFDDRYIYWDPDASLLDRERREFVEQLIPRNLFLEARQKESISFFARGYVTSVLSDNFGNGLSSFFPLFLRSSEVQPRLDAAPNRVRPNLSENAQKYLAQLNAAESGLVFFHSVAIINSPTYRREHDEALRQDWPRIPLPATEEALKSSAKLGERIAGLFDAEREVRGVTIGSVRSELKGIGSLAVVDGKALRGIDLQVTADWGRPQGEIVMPGKGKIFQRPYTDEEIELIAQGSMELGLTREEALSALGPTTCDIYLNEKAYWRNVPLNVWKYTIGGYQVIKKWLSYREEKVLRRAVTADEAHFVRDIARRIAALCLLQPALDANYTSVKTNTYSWPAASTSK